MTFIDGLVQIAPLAADLDVGLVDADRPAMRLAEDRNRRSISDA